MKPLGKKTLREIRDILSRFEGSAMEEISPIEVLRAIRALADALKTKKFVKASRTRRVAKAKTRKQKVSEIRAAVVARADGLCECGGISACSGALQMDHFFGGNGRRRALESVATCWVLCRGHHDLKTIGLPDAVWWVNRFIMHCNKYGYADAASMAQARRDSLALQGRTGEQT